MHHINPEPATARRSANGVADHDHDHPHDHDHGPDHGHDHDHATESAHDRAHRLGETHDHDDHGHDHGESAHDRAHRLGEIHDHDDHGHDHGESAHDRAHRLGETHDHDDHDHGDHSHGDHDHDHDHGHSHGKVPVFLAWLPFFHGHSHGPAQLDRAASTREGLRTLVLSFLALMLTALAQLVVVILSGSVALFADTIHNFGDALSAVPLGIAFLLARRLRNNSYTFGYGRAEDLAGVIIVLLILSSAVFAGWESFQKLLNPQPMDYVWVVAAAAVIGFIGNELVAEWRIRVGKRIGSASLIADGQHARVDGFTSLAVLGAVIGTLVGFPILDPIVGLLLTVAILKIVWDQGRVMWHRMMDAVDPAIVASIDRVARRADGVEGTDNIRARWVGRELLIDLHIQVDGRLSLIEGHHVAEIVRHHLFHELDHVGEVYVHVDPAGEAHTHAHQLTAHHA